MISVNQFCTGRRKHIHQLSSKRLHIDRQINPKFVPSAQSMFRLRKKRRAQYPLLTTHEDYNLKYVGSLSENIIKYDPFKKIPTIKLARHFSNSLNMSSPEGKYREMRVHENTTGTARISRRVDRNKIHRSPIRANGKQIAAFKEPSSTQPAKVRLKKKVKKQVGNPFRRYDPSPEEIWLLKRCTL